LSWYISNISAVSATMCCAATIAPHNIMLSIVQNSRLLLCM
jgi:hypothetical protein